MRIIAGRLGGLRLPAQVPNSARPTSDRVREALFSVLGARLELCGACILDLFAGTGALGLEALSRGGRHVLAVEQDARALSAIEKNVTALGVDDQVRLLRADVGKLTTAQIQRAAGHGEAFDLLLLDPPYRDVQVALDFLARECRAPLVHEHTLIALEHRSGDVLELPQNLAVVRSYRYGDTSIVLLSPIA